MKEITKGWVILTEKHSWSGNAFMLSHTFATTRSKSIEIFTNQSSETWRHIRKDLNYKCVKAENIISTLES